MVKTYRKIKEISGLHKIMLPISLSNEQIKLIHSNEELSNIWTNYIKDTLKDNRPEELHDKNKNNRYYPDILPDSTQLNQ